MTKPLCVLDRFEGDKGKWAVIEYNGELTFNLPRGLLPDSAEEGDVIEFNLNIDKGNTDSRRKVAEALLKQLFEGNSN